MYPIDGWVPIKGLGCLIAAAVAWTVIIVFAYRTARIIL